jgi:hypothetical protein
MLNGRQRIPMSIRIWSSWNFLKGQVPMLWGHGTRIGTDRTVDFSHIVIDYTIVGRRVMFTKDQLQEFIDITGEAMTEEDEYLWSTFNRCGRPVEGTPSILVPRNERYYQFTA